MNMPSHTSGFYGTRLSLLGPARILLYAGLFMVSLLLFRVGGAITIGDALLISSFLLTTADTVVHGRRVSLPLLTVTAFALVCLGGILTSFSAADPSGGLSVLARIVLLAFFIPWTMSVLLNTPRRMRIAFLAVAGGSALCGAGAIAQLVLGDIIPGTGVTSGGRYPGFAAHVSDTGGIVCLSVVYGAALMFGVGKVTKAVGALMFSVGLSGLILSGSVSGMIAAAIGILALVIWHRLSLFKTAALATFLAIGSAWAVQAMATNERALTPLERLTQATGMTGDSSLNTTASRWESIEAGLKSISESPIIGAGIEPSAAPTIRNLPAHNILVSSLYQGGIFFALGLCLVVIPIACKILRKAWNQGLYAAAAGGLVTAVVFAMTAPSFYNRYFWVPLALALAAMRLSHMRSMPPTRAYINHQCAHTALTCPGRHMGHLADVER